MGKKDDEIRFLRDWNEGLTKEVIRLKGLLNNPLRVYIVPDKYMGELSDLCDTDDREETRLSKYQLWSFLSKALGVEFAMGESWSLVFTDVLHAKVVENRDRD